MWHLAQKYDPEHKLWPKVCCCSPHQLCCSASSTTPRADAHLLVCHVCAGLQKPGGGHGVVDVSDGRYWANAGDFRPPSLPPPSPVHLDNTSALLAQPHRSNLISV